MKCAPDSDDPFTFDGPEIYKTKGTEIQWKEGKNVTIQKTNAGGQEIEMKVHSFFNFFNPPETPEETQSPLFDAINAILEADFEIGHFIKDRVVPRAVLYFTGEARDEEDDEESLDDSNPELLYENEQDLSEEKEEEED